MQYPATITSETELDDLLSQPSEAVIESVRQWDGDLMILGCAGKIGISLGRMAVRAFAAAGLKRRVLGVDLFPTPTSRALVEAAGVEAIPCNLLDQSALTKLPSADHIVFMVGRKFGTQGDEEMTWAVNTLIPWHAAMRFPSSNIVSFSTGCVYPLVDPLTGGCTEADAAEPVGEYAQSCLGRERVFQYASKINQTPVCLLRLNYAIDLRYGVLHDIAQKIWEGKPVDLTVGHANCIWQGDVNCVTLQALNHCQLPPNILNITGPETLSVRFAATRMAAVMGKPVSFTGQEGGIAYLNNSAKAQQLFGYPSVSIPYLLDWTANWIKAGGASLGKPTHFEVNTGKY